MTYKQMEQMKEMYMQGMKYEDIAKELGFTTQYIGMKARQYYEMGILPDRKEIRKRKKEEKIIELYNKNYTLREMSEQIGCTLDNISKIIQRLIREGKLQRRVRMGTPRKGIKKKKPVPEASENGVGIKCTKEISANCIFGANKGVNLCNYICLTGHSRGCKAACCTKYKEGKPLDGRSTFNLNGM